MAKLNFVSLMAFLLIAGSTFTSCKKNNCPEGFEGPDCATWGADKFIGIYDVEIYCKNFGSPDHVSEITDLGDGRIEIDNFGDSYESLKAEVNGNKFTFDDNLDGFGRYKGKGKLSSDGKSIEISYRMILMGVRFDKCELEYTLQ